MALVAGLSGVVSTAAAHDTWLIPDLFSAAQGQGIVVRARAGGGKFPAGSAVQVARVAGARVVGPTRADTVTDLAPVSGALLLTHKPTAAGQYLVALSLTPGTLRNTAAGFLRFLRAEGATAEAVRLERENVLSGMDSVVFAHAAYAAVVVQVGQGGPRGFARTAGLPLEFVPVNDPAHVRVGDTLHVRVLAGGKAVPGIGVDFKSAAADTTASGPNTTYAATLADAQGIVHLPLTAAGPWIVRSAFVSPKAGGARNEFVVSRSTYVWNVGTSH